MAVPETSKNLDDSLVPWKDDIWMARQVLSVKTKSKAVNVQQLAYQFFRASVFAANAAHHPASFRL